MMEQCDQKYFIIQRYCGIAVEILNFHKIEREKER